MAQTLDKRVGTPFSIDPESDLPVGTQVAWRLRALIVTGRLPAGDQLPSVRRMAEWAGVNVNTVRAVYAGLEEDGLVETGHGRGTFVAEGVEPAPELEAIVGDALTRAREAALDPRELAVVAMACAGMPDTDAESPSEAVELPDAEQGSEMLEVRQELRRQIGRLEAELGAYVRDLPAGNVDSVRPAEPRIVGVEDLELTRDRLIEQLSEAQQAAEQRARQEAEARIQREAMLSDPAAHKWQVVSAEEAGEPSCVEHRVVPRLGPLGMAMDWWRVKVSGGCP